MDSNSYEYLLNDSVLLNIKLVLEQSKDTLEQAHERYDNQDVITLPVLMTVLCNTLSTTQSELIDLIEEMLKLKKAVRSILDIS